MFFYKKSLLCICASLFILILTNCQSINTTREKIDIPEKVVIFTFDDGPNAHAQTTEKLLDILKKYNITGMFALLGENVNKNPELAKRIYDEGHFVINHGYSDRFACNMDETEFYDNLIAGKKEILDAIGENSYQYQHLYRPQGGFYKKKHKEILDADNYIIIPATARAYDAVKSESKKNEIINTIIDKVEKQNGGIILLHDAYNSYQKMEKGLIEKPDGPFNRSWIPGAVEEIIIILQEKNYILTDIDIASILGISIKTESKPAFY